MLKMEKFVRFLVRKFLPQYHLKHKPKRVSKPRAPRVKKIVQEKTNEQPT